MTRIATMPSSAAAIARRLLEDGEGTDWTPEPGDPDALSYAAVERFTGTQPFDEGAEDIVADARALYRRLQKDGTLAVVEKSGVDNLSIAQALIRIAIEKRGSKGGVKAYRLFNRHGMFVL